MIIANANGKFNNELEFYLERNLPFIFDNKEKKLIKISMVSEDLTKEDISKIMCKEINSKIKPSIIINNPNFVVYKHLFS